MQFSTAALKIGLYTADDWKTPEALERKDAAFGIDIILIFQGAMRRDRHTVS